MECCCICNAKSGNVARIRENSGEGTNGSRDVLQKGSHPDPALYATLLKSCGNARDLLQGKRVHAHILGSKHHRNRYLGNLLLEMYGKCHSLEDARAVFEKIEKPNLFSWNIMMTAYAQNGHLKEAVCMFNSMPEKDVVSWNSMIAAHAENGNLHQARRMFDQMPVRDVVSWNTMITAYAQNGQMQQAKCLFDQMSKKDVVTGNAMIAGYARSGQLQAARSMFDQMSKRNVVSWNTLISAYAQNGYLHEARKLFEKMPERDAISTTVMVTAYAQSGELQEAKRIFEKSSKRDVLSWTAMIAAYAQNGHVEEAKSMFDSTSQRDVVSWNAMVAAYAQHGDLHEARILFEQMPQRDVVSWNEMIFMYARNGQALLAIQCFSLLDLDGVEPDKVTFVGALDACAHQGALREGRLVHESMVGVVQADVILGNALVNMYGKCGSLEDARCAFEKWPCKDVVLWSTMVAAYVENGRGRDAVQLFRDMLLQGMGVDQVTFITILCKCSHAGLLHSGCDFFVSIYDHGMRPTLEHYVCMIDLLGRAGWLEDARELIDCMPFEPDAVAWTTLLAACKIHGDMELAVRAAERALQLDPQDSTAFLLLSNAHSHVNETRDFE